MTGGGAGRKMRVAMVGNCQAEVAAIAVQRLAAEARADCVFINDRIPLTTANRAFLAGADLVVTQEGGPRVQSPAGCRLMTMPLLAANFLWPFSTEDHPLNPTGKAEFCLHGPYDQQVSDAFLNRLMRDDPGADPRALADRYMAADFATMVDLDAVFVADRATALARDARAGTDHWRSIEGVFRDHPAFWTSLHPAGWLMRALCRPVLEAVAGGPSRTVDNALFSLDDPMEFLQAPIHPSVRRHFGLRWCHDGTRSRFFKEGVFTGWEYARRYVEFAYDPVLARTVGAYDGGAPAADIIDTLEACFLRHPESADVAYYYSHALLALGRRAEALELANRAVSREPARPVFAAHLVRAVNAFAAVHLSVPRLPLDARVSFAHGDGEARGIAAAGWTHPQQWGVLSDAPASRLVFAVAADQGARLDLEFEIIPVPATPAPIEVQVSVGGRAWTTWRLDGTAECLRHVLDVPAQAPLTLTLAQPPGGEAGRIGLRGMTARRGPQWISGSATRAAPSSTP